MDKFVEIAAYYFIDWQQTAIANTRYSVVLIAAAIFIGGLIMFLLKRSRLNALNQSLEREKDTLQQVEKKNAELLSKEKDLSKQIEALQRQMEQVTVKSKQENAEHHAEFKKNKEQYRQDIDKKQVELVKLQSVVSDKEQSNAQLQSDLNEQKNKLSQHALDQVKLVEIEKEYNQLNSEFKVVKDQVVQQEIELNDKKTEVEQLHKSTQSTDTTSTRIAELEAELEKNNMSDNSTVLQQKLVDMETELARLQQVNVDVENSSDVSSQVEMSILQQTEKLAHYNEKLESFLQSGSNANEDASASTVSAKKSEGFINKVKDMIASFDNVDVSDKSQFRKDDGEELAEEDVWDKYQRLMDQLINDFTDGFKAEESIETKAVIEEVAEVAEVEEETIERVAEDSSDEELLVEESSGKFDDVVEKMDSLQDKVLGFYRKIRS